MSTNEAAQVLGVSDRRVRQMIASGDLDAEQSIGGYVLDSKEVEALTRAREANESGDPRPTDRQMLEAILAEVQALRRDVAALRNGRSKRS